MPVRLPLEDVWDGVGAAWGEEAGWRVPLHFGDAASEHRAVRTGVGVADLSHRGTGRLGGAERVDFLHRMLSSDVAGVAPPGWTPALWLTHKGKVAAEMRAIMMEAEAILDLPPEGVGAILERLEMFILSSDVTVVDATAGTGLLSVHGPGAAECIRSVAGSVAALPAGRRVASLAVGGVACVVVPSSWSGEEGFDLIHPAEGAGALWESLREAGDVRPVGAEAREMLRIEAGVPRYGRDFDDDTIPLEANLEEAICLTKGCFPGQEVVARATHRGGVRRRLRGLVIDMDRPPPDRSVVLAAGEEAGWVSSAVRVPGRDRPIALAYVRDDKIDSGSLEVRTDGGSHAAELVTLPFYRRDSR